MPKKSPEEKPKFIIPSGVTTSRFDGPEQGVLPSDVLLMGDLVKDPSQDPPVTAGEIQAEGAKETWPRTIEVTRGQAEALARILERDRTAWETHGGLKGLLSLSQPDVDALAALVEKLKA